MADRGGRTVPGPVYIEVEYDYEYEAKEKMIVIKQGEKYILVKKTNEDWWQVKKDEHSKPFYVPAQYVKEVARKALMPPVKPPGLLSTSSLKLIQGLQRSIENVNKSTELSSFGKSSSGQIAGLVQDVNQNIGPNTSPGQTKGLSLDLAQNNEKLSGGLPSPKSSSQKRSPSVLHFPLPEFMETEKTSFSNEQSCDSAGDSSEGLHQDSESGDELSRSSTEHVQPTTPPPPALVRSESPVYANLQELKISQSALPPFPNSSPVQVNGEWETHTDSTGRSYYYNRATQERTWKPPRCTRETSGSKGDPPNHTDNEHFSSEEICHGSCYSQSDRQCDSPPKGWSEELDEHGHTLYISEHTNEKWMKHVDDQGRQYYYNADGSRSEWELPKYKASLQPQKEIIKSRSLDRRLQDPIVLTKWRHSTCMLDINDKDSPTSSKSYFPDESSPSSPKHQSTEEKYGVLNVTKITENGKKVRKNWTSAWAVLQGSSLLFPKIQGSGTSWKFGSNQSKPEFTVDLKGAVIEWASKDKSSKKNVIELKTRQGMELLIQSDNDGLINEWFKALCYTINNQVGDPEEAVEDDVPDSPGAEKQDKEKDQRDSKKSRSIKTSNSVDSSEQKKTKTKLKKFLTRRPTLQAVREKGYIKDQVFGSSLTSLYQRENTSVPKFVKLCIQYVEEHGLEVDGLYRVSGNLAVIQKLRFAVNHDEKLDLNDSKWEDIHVVSGALKMFFRELPEPLFTYNHFNDFVNAIKQEPRQRVQAVKDLIKQLPKPNQETMQVLFRHLKKVVEVGEKNRMNVQSLAIVFGPTLLRPEKETGNIVHTVYQNQIVELILLEFPAIFGS